MSNGIVCDRCRGLCRPEDMVQIGLRWTRQSWCYARKLHYHPACWNFMSGQIPEGILWDADGVLRAEGKNR